MLGEQIGVLVRGWGRAQWLEGLLNTGSQLEGTWGYLVWALIVQMRKQVGDIPKVPQPILADGVGVGLGATAGARGPRTLGAR